MSYTSACGRLRSMIRSLKNRTTGVYTGVQVISYFYLPFIKLMILRTKFKIETNFNTVVHVDIIQ